MKMFAVAAVLATLVASPAFAQSYDPDIGSGNIAPNASIPSQGGFGAYAWAPGYGAFAQVPPRGHAVRSHHARHPNIRSQW
jgi:hypothetical protein